jgi:hypothetical protein
VPPTLVSVACVPTVAELRVTRLVALEP